MTEHNATHVPVDWERAAIGWRVAKMGDEQDAADWAYEHLDAILEAGAALAEQIEKLRQGLQ